MTRHQLSNADRSKGGRTHAQRANPAAHGLPAEAWALTKRRHAPCREPLGAAGRALRRLDAVGWVIRALIVKAEERGDGTLLRKAVGLLVQLDRLKKCYPPLSELVDTIDDDDLLRRLAPAREAVQTEPRVLAVRLMSGTEWLAKERARGGN